MKCNQGLKFFGEISLIDQILVVSWPKYLGGGVRPMEVERCIDHFLRKIGNISRKMGDFFKVFFNVFRTGPVIEPEKLPVHGSLVGPAVEPLSNRYRTGDVINI